jgi:K+/H+ antiporter YhaU regulatory subunit KhtT
MNISALRIEANSTADRKSLSEIQLRSKTGVTLLAIKRGSEIIEHPNPSTTFQPNDTVYLLGNPEQINLAFELFNKEI